jgi:hypothetical protein
MSVTDYWLHTKEAFTASQTFSLYCRYSYTHHFILGLDENLIISVIILDLICEDFCEDFCFTRRTSTIYFKWMSTITWFKLMTASTLGSISKILRDWKHGFLQVLSFDMLIWISLQYFYKDVNFCFYQWCMVTLQISYIFIKM